ncbi:MAG: hypothetical protein DYG93_06075 [Leptolyngbya sp. PLA2]|nr:hypothetical protein [Leptolyngbya sp. PL-A2]MCQ3940894.1 hypothetical protein [cyanobacterium CYA1]
MHAHAAAFIAAAASVAQAGIVTSTFDTGTEGWVVSDSMLPPSEISTAGALHVLGFGNPGGFITVPGTFDPGEAAFVAPAKFLGNKTGAIGGTFLTLDRRVWDPPHNNNPQQVDYAYDITISGNGVILGYDLPPTTLRWSSYSVPIGVGMGWTNLDTNLPATLGDITAALSALDDLRIRANLNDIGVNSGLDNVVLIPAPGTIGVLALAGLVCCRRRR